MIEITVGVAYSKVESRIPKGLNDLLWGECAYELANAEHLPYSGWRRLYHRTRRVFPTGVLWRVLAVIEEQGYEVQLNYQQPRDVKRHVLPAIPAAYALRLYQQKAVHRVNRVVRDELGIRCMVRIATGGGKTVVAGHLIGGHAVTTAFFVHTKDLLYQAKDTFIEMWGEQNVGQVGDGIVDIKPVTVVTIQTATRCLKKEYEAYDYDDAEPWNDEETAKMESDQQRVAQWLIERVDMVIMDECHRVAAPTASAVIMSCLNARMRIGFSASPWRDDGADMELEGIFGRVEVDVSASELQELGFLVPAYIRFVDVPPKRFKKTMQYSTLYSEYVVNNEDRNRIVVERTIGLIDRQKPTLILVRMISHGEVLQRMLLEEGYDIPFLSGRDSSMHRYAVLKELKANRLQGLIATTIADEGLDIKPLAGLVLAAGGKSSTRALQRVGRVLRPFEGKKFAEVVDFEDHARWLSKHSAERAAIYRSEPGWTILDL